MLFVFQEIAFCVNGGTCYNIAFLKSRVSVSLSSISLLFDNGPDPASSECTCIYNMQVANRLPMKKMMMHWAMVNISYSLRVPGGEREQVPGGWIVPGDGVAQRLSRVLWVLYKACGLCHGSKMMRRYFYKEMYMRLTQGDEVKKRFLQSRVCLEPLGVHVVE